MQQIQPTFLTFCLHLLERIYCLFRAPRTEKDDEEAEIDTSDAKDGRLACSSNCIQLLRIDQLRTSAPDASELPSFQAVQALVVIHTD